jgi:phage tail-like protein
MTRYDPYKGFRFLVYFCASSTPVAAASRATGLTLGADVIDYRGSGGLLVRKAPGRDKYEPITLERGITQDINFSSWASNVQSASAGSSGPPLQGLRRELRIDFLNELGDTASRYHIHRAWVSEYQALPDLDAGSNAIAIEHIKIENEGWERDVMR